MFRTRRSACQSSSRLGLRSSGVYRIPSRHTNTMGMTCGRAYWSAVARCATRAVVRSSRACAERSGTQAGEDLARIEAHRALLVLAREVEDQVREAPFHVAADLRDMLVGIGGDDEARVRLVRRGLGAALHLTRILDPGLVLGRQRERGPLTRVRHGAVALGVEGDLHLDRPLDLPGVASGLTRAGLDRGQQRFAVQLVALAAGADEAIGFPAGERRRLRTGCGDIERNTIPRLVEDLRPARLEVLAFKGHVVVGPQLLHELHSLAEPTEAPRGDGPDRCA